MASNRKTTQEIVDQLQARSSSPEVQLFKELLNLRFEDAKNDLVNASAENFQMAQGQARMLQQLIRQLERPTLNVSLIKEI